MNRNGDMCELCDLGGSGPKRSKRCHRLRACAGPRLLAAMLGLAMVALLAGLFGMQLALPAGSVVEQHSPAKGPTDDPVTMTAMVQGTPLPPSRTHPHRLSPRRRPCMHLFPVVSVHAIHEFE